MATRILPTLSHGLRTPLFIASFGCSTALFLQAYRSRYSHAYKLDNSPASTSPKDWSFSQYQRDASTPVVTSGGGLNARAIRQMSAGSIFGLIAGLGVSVFSKPLAVLLGLLVVGVQTAESYGIHLVPYRTIGKYVQSVDVRSAVQDNVAFKISFGLMFALAGFAEF